MSIFLDAESRVCVQGITGRDGLFHTKAMIEYGTKVVAGVTPGKGGRAAEGVPVFDTVKDAVANTGADATIVFVPARFAVGAIAEAVDAGIGLIVAVSEGIPVLDAARLYGRVRAAGARMIGPNCPGIISPGKSKLGIMPGSIHSPGEVGVVSRSGTLTYEVVDQLRRRGIGQSTVIGIGGDPIIGTNFIDALAAFEADPETAAVVLIGEIGGTDEEEAAAFIRAKMRKPLVSFIAGRTAPADKRMGHAGAIIAGGKGTAKEKIEALRAAGVPVADRPSEIPDLVREALGRRA
ncbi:MAG: succinate--CoA ligase subunit alpha [Candidatus Eisenbacteria bacterium]|nr:succinate--CoA ligase subunit alpha [Candidatus Eisenbacteria bacterium]